MADDNAVLLIEGDAESAIEALAAIEDTLSLLEERIFSLSDTLDALDFYGAFDGLNAVLADSMTAVAALQASIDELGTSADAALASLNDSVSVVPEEADAAAGAVDTLSASLDTLDASLADTTNLQEMLASVAGNTMQALDEEAQKAQDAAAALREKQSASDNTKDAQAGTAGAASDTADELENEGANAEIAAYQLLMLAQMVWQAAQSFMNLGVQAQSSLNILIGLTGATAQDAQTYTDGLSQLALQLGVTMDQAAQGMYMVASAGYTGADGINVLRYALAESIASGAKAADTARALTGVMNSYGATAQQAGYYSDLVTNAVTFGAQTFSEFATSIGAAATTGASAGFSFDQVATAEALMTHHSLDAHRAVMDLDFLMRAIGINSANVAAQAQKMGLNFNYTAFQSDNLLQRLQYLHQITIDNANAFVKFAESNPDASMTQLSDLARQLGVNFDASKYATMNASQRLQYLGEISGNANSEFMKLVGGANSMLAASILLQGGGKNYEQLFQQITHGAGSTKRAFDQAEQGIGAAMDHIKASLSVLSFAFVQAITPIAGPLLKGVSDALGNFGQALQHNGGLALTVFSALATFIGGVLIGVLVLLISTFAAVIGPLLMWPAIIAGIIGLLVLLVTHWNAVTHAFSGVIPVGAWAALWNALKQIGAFLGGALMNSIKEIGAAFSVAWKQIVTAIQPILPLLSLLVGIIGVGLVVAIGVAVGTLTGLAHALATFISGIAMVIGGVVQVVMGFLTIIQGLVVMFIGQLTGNEKLIHNGFKQILQGIGNIITGLIGVLTGLFHAVVGTILTGLLGFAAGFLHVIGSFIGQIPGTVAKGLGQTLQNVASFVEGAIHWAAQLPGQFISFIIDLVNGVIDQFTQLYDTTTNTIGSLPGRFFSWGIDMINNIISGIGSKLGSLGSMVGNVANIIASFLHFSKPDVGPLASVDEWMPDFGDVLTKGLNAQVGKVRAASLNVAMAISQSAPNGRQVGAFNAATAQGAGTSNDQMVRLLTQIANATQAHLTLAQQQHQMASRGGIGGPPLNANVPTVSQYNTVNLGNSGALQNALLQNLYQQLNVMAGRANEYGSRGSPVGLG